MTDLPAFLRARLDEDASDMAAAQPMPGQNSRLATMQGTTILMAATRALAEIDAKRRIIAEYESAATFYTNNPKAPAGEAFGLFTAMRLLALPYAAHPDYQKTWAP